MSRTVFSALSGMRLLACLIVAPQQGYDEPAIISYAISPFCPTGADGLHPAIRYRLKTKRANFKQQAVPVQYSLMCCLRAPIANSMQSSDRCSNGELTGSSFSLMRS